MAMSIGSNPLSSLSQLLSSPLIKALGDINPQAGAMLKELASSLDSFGGQASGAGATNLGGSFYAPPAHLANTTAAFSGSGPSAAQRADALSSISGAGAAGGADPLSAASGGGAIDTGNGTANSAIGEFGKDLDPAMAKQLEYQQKLQKQTEAFSLISNLMKMLHDAFQQWAGNLK